MQNSGHPSFQHPTHPRKRREDGRGTQAVAAGQAEREGEQGFLLVGVIVMVALVLIFLSVAAPVVAKDLRREKELETEHRGREYTHAVRMFYKKFNAYPGSIEALEKTNNIRYLRKRYVDPMTGKDDWRVIPVGQAKTTVKGFFGEPLSGLASGGLGSASGLASGQQPGTSPFGGQSGLTGATSGTNAGGSGTAGSGTGGTNAGGTGTGGSGTGAGRESGSGFGASSFGSPSSSSSNPLSGGAGPFVGVGIKKNGASIITLNEQTDYSTWEFIYDPRIEQLLSKVSLFGGGVASQSSGSLGSASGLSSTPGSSTTPFGSSTSGTSSSGTSSGGSTSPSTPPTSPQ